MSHHSSDYINLVNTLLKPITPQLRQVILRNLTIMNDRLLEQATQEIDLDTLVDNISTSTRKKDSLDLKLDKITKLQDKILSDRDRKKNRQKNEKTTRYYSNKH